MPTSTSEVTTDPVTAEEDEPVPPFFNTTFSTHRVSPLYVGVDKLTPQRLGVLGRRLRDTLVGDVVRGIQIGLESTDTPAGQVGPLRSVKLRWFRANAVLGDEVDYDNDTGMDTWDALSESQKRGLWIEIRHENAAYVAILLPGVGSKDTRATWRMQPGQSVEATGDDGFVHLPLMLLRMPMALKGVISEWLAGTFDCRVSKLALGTRTLVAVWEDWIRTVGVSPRGMDPVITLAFNAPLPEPESVFDDNNDPDAMQEDEYDEHNSRPGLRSLEVTIQPKELAKFVRVGKTGSSRPTAGAAGAYWEKDVRERRRLAGASTDDGWAWLASEDRQQPFTDGLARYLDHHLGLNVFHPSVRVTQISCGGFVLGAARLKIVAPGQQMTDAKSRASWMFVTRLSHRIQGDGLPTIFT
ncbi:hypothetical protein GMORB2_4314 [Geosmithia morbida]|uniref:Siroheme synthase n=1 Tax=Geosmithia morbida TaxID=1094350 RepID=A0A9P4Z2K0_9HYPO|nr:uncharacterized protein GMORB2_4314 [Geosmithia morbida]KAF4125474.1 hypothetical protein GMORB2_4314 [Geosmithia morbida]